MENKGGCLYQFKMIISLVFVSFPLWGADLLSYDSDKRHFERLYKY
jgi:hypothetical protein